MSARELRHWVAAQVRSAMTAAMRTDPHALDRLAGANASSEAWRRADAWYAENESQPVLLGVEPFDEGFIARPAVPPHEVRDQVLIIDRNTGAMTLWPAYDADTLRFHYRDYERGNL